MAGSGGRHGPSRSNLQGSGNPPRRPTELPRGICVVFSGLARQAQTIGITRVEAALVFFLRGAESFLAGRCVPMCWDCCAGGLDGLDTPSSALDGLSGCLDDPSRWCSRALRGAKVYNFHKCFHESCSFGASLVMHSGEHRQFMFSMAVYTPPKGLLGLLGPP